MASANATCDAIVVGAGHNGLACACYLARAGLKVLALEQYHAVGGMTLTEEVTLPGFWSDLHASGYQLANIAPAPAELELTKYGLELCVPANVYAHAFPDGRAIVVSRDLEQTVASIARHSARDAATFRGLVERYRAGREEFIAGFFSPPADFAADMAALAREPDGLDAYRFRLQSLRAWADEQFESAEAKALFAGFAVFVGAAPDDAGGAEIAWLFGLVLQEEGNNLVKGGMHHVSLALAADLAAHGGEVRTGATVDRIVVAGGRATGVRLTTGEEIAAGRLVVSATDPGRLVDRFLGADVVGAAIAEKMERYEWGDATMVIFAALDGPVDYAAGEALGQAAHVHLTPSLDALATMAVECRAGQLPATPLIVAWNDSAIDPSRAPAGKHLKKFVVLSVPYEIAGDATGRIAGRDWDQVKEAYADYLFDLMAASYLPDLKNRLLKRVVHSPRDLERTLPSAVRGTISHGAMVPYQMGGLRPIPELGHYRTPVGNVYACDSGNHPGPGVSMGPGRNAAQVICGDLGIAFPGVRPKP